jgi:beta-glucanase (GH16 family)
MKATLLLLSCLILQANHPTEKKGKLIWSDEFNYSGQPDSTKWNYETGDGCPNLCGWGNNQLEVYTNHPTNVRVENGSLVIDAVKNNCQWTSARITNKGKINFTYGRVEFRAKLPAGKGSWPALWMLGESVTTKGWPACGEIDVMEHIGRDPGIVQSVLHTPASFGNTVNKASWPVETFQSFHIYEANWTRDKIQFSVDGVVFYTFQPAEKNEKTWPFDSPFYIIMNVAMGGNLGGPASDPNLTLARMEVDYVRVYQ